MTSEREVTVESDADIVRARQAGRSLAAEMGFTAGDATLIATAISELARNILLYAHQGEIGVTMIEAAARRGVRVIARDDGPGIPDVERALQEGFSTSRSLGMGLSGVKRLVDDFKIVSEPGRGTTVIVKKWK